jgi:hypothetical protein
MNFVISLFRDTMVFDVSLLDCANLLLGHPYQQDYPVVYHDKTHQYHLQLEGHTYVLTYAAPKSTQPITGHETIKQVGLNKHVSLFLVHPIKEGNFYQPCPSKHGSSAP